jgi:hypothetical protein
MKLTKEEYPNREEKRKDFWLGVVIFITLNTLMVLAVLLLARIQGLRGRSSNDLVTFIYLILNFLPYVINIGLLIYFFLTRDWIALGMLAAWGFFMVLVLLAGIVFVIFCFVSLSTGL